MFFFFFFSEIRGGRKRERKEGNRAFVRGRRYTSLYNPDSRLNDLSRAERHNWETRCSLGKR